MDGGLMPLPQRVMPEEPSLGLAPLVLKEIFWIVQEINAAWAATLLVEGKVRQALAISGRACVPENGRIVLVGRGADLLQHEQTQQAHLGM
jgi:branched-chain amino acid transport system ATP-binding protein